MTHEGKTMVRRIAVLPLAPLVADLRLAQARRGRRAGGWRNVALRTAPRWW